ncbi:MAG: RNase H family protein [Nitrososphaerales archaeon]
MTHEVAIDGSKLGNGRAGWAVYWGHDHPLTMAGECPEGTTCALAEVLALEKVLEQLLQHPQPVRIACDNMYVVKGYNEWLSDWVRKDFYGLAHPHQWRVISQLKQQVGSLVTLYHVNGHTGHEGNECADRLANGQSLPNIPNIPNIPKKDGSKVPPPSRKTTVPIPNQPGIIITKVQYGIMYKLPKVSGALILYDKGTYLAQGPFWQEYVKF